MQAEQTCHGFTYFSRNTEDTRNDIPAIPLWAEKGPLGLQRLYPNGPCILDHSQVAVVEEYGQSEMFGNELRVSNVDLAKNRGIPFRSRCNDTRPTAMNQKNEERGIANHPALVPTQWMLPTIHQRTH